MNKPELEALLEELDAALVKAFPGPVPNARHPEPGASTVRGGSVLPFPHSPSRIPVAPHTGWHLREITFQSHKATTALPGSLFYGMLSVAVACSVPAACNDDPACEGTVKRECTDDLSIQDPNTCHGLRGTCFGPGR